MIRSRDEDGPWIPGLAARFEWPDADDPDENMIRERVQDNGVNLFVLYLPIKIGGTRPKCLCAAYYPDECLSATYNMLDPRQKADFALGRLVVLKTLEVAGTQTLGDGFGSVNIYLGPLTDRMIEEVRRNNRNARKELKRNSSKAALASAIKDAQEVADQKAMDDSGFLDAYVEGYMDSERYVRGNAFVSGANGGAR